VQDKKPDGTLFYKLVEPPGHSVLGPEQMQWLLDALQASKATWKFLFLPVEINPRYDALLNKAMTELPVPILLEAVGLAERDVPDYYEVDHTKMTAKMTRIPLPSEVPYPVMMEPNLVIEFYSR
jgi:ribosomal protein S4